MYAKVARINLITRLFILFLLTKINPIEIIIKPMEANESHILSSDDINLTTLHCLSANYYIMKKQEVQTRYLLFCDDLKILK